jgi:hypothetical protein
MKHSALNWVQCLGQLSKSDNAIGQNNYVLFF